MSLGGRVVIKLTIWGELKRNGSTKTPSPSQLLLWNQHDLLIVVYGKTGSRAGIIHSEGGKKKHYVLYHVASGWQRRERREREKLTTTAASR